MFGQKLTSLVTIVENQDTLAENALKNDSPEELGSICPQGMSIMQKCMKKSTKKRNTIIAMNMRRTITNGNIIQPKELDEDIPLGPRLYTQRRKIMKSSNCVEILFKMLNQFLLMKIWKKPKTKQMKKLNLFR